MSKLRVAAASQLVEMEYHKKMYSAFASFFIPFFWPNRETRTFLFISHFSHLTTPDIQHFLCAVYIRQPGSKASMHIHNKKNYSGCCFFFCAICTTIDFLHELTWKVEPSNEFKRPGILFFVLSYFFSYFFSLCFLLFGIWI